VAELLGLGIPPQGGELHPAGEARGSGGHSGTSKSEPQVEFRLPGLTGERTSDGIRAGQIGGRAAQSVLGDRIERPDAAGRRDCSLLDRSAEPHLGASLVHVEVEVEPLDGGVSQTGGGKPEIDASIGAIECWTR
jgi:hypothetical protein